MNEGDGNNMRSRRKRKVLCSNLLGMTWLAFMRSQQLWLPEQDLYRIESIDNSYGKEAATMPFPPLRLYRQLMFVQSMLL